MSNDTYRQVSEHRHYKYRGCAPDLAHPSRAAGDLDLSTDAWSPSTVEGGEDQRARLAREKAALAVCAVCPVVQSCRAYGLATTPDGKQLVEPEGILGGMLALDRHRYLIQQRLAAPATRTAAPVVELRATDIEAARTVQKQAVLAALARETDPNRVAARAGRVLGAPMDVRTANWQRSALCSLLGLDKETATRQQLLDTARQYGVLPDVQVIPDRRPVAAAPDTTGARQRRITEAAPPEPPADPMPADVRRVPAPRRDKFARVTGQLSLDDLPNQQTAALRLVPALPATVPARLETVA